MCGRFTFSKNQEAIATKFKLKNLPEITPRYNIAPNQQLPAIIVTDHKELKLFKWGLIPSWATDDKMGIKLINARTETVSTKPAFRNAFRSQRCLILADGFYEWRMENNQKQPYYFTMKDHEIFAFAGLWETWQNPEGEIINTCTILTTKANKIVSEIHARMPAILIESDYDLWLDTKIKKTDILVSILKPYSAEKMVSYPVSLAVNKINYDGIDCIKKIN